MQPYRVQVRNYIVANLMFVDDGVELQDSDDIFESGMVNSLFAMRLIDFVSIEFSVEIGDDDIRLDNFNSVDNICNLIDRYRS